MPELPEVESIRRMLLEKVIGKVIIGSETGLPRIIKQGELNSLIGRCFTGIERYGKYLRFTTDTDLTLYSHFRMTGTFLWLGLKEKEPTHIRARILFSDGEMQYRDTRTLGGLWITEDGQRPWKQLGPDPFSQECSAETLKKLLSGRSIPIKVALLDQAVIAGIGNIYASEALFASGIHPAQKADSLSVEELNRIIESARIILQSSIDSGGTTFRDFRLSDGKEGAFKAFLKVYGKAGEKCDVCGYNIKRIVQAQRSTFFCPVCQPELIA